MARTWPWWWVRFTLDGTEMFRIIAADNEKELKRLLEGRLGGKVEVLEFERQDIASLDTA